MEFFHSVSIYFEVVNNFNAVMSFGKLFDSMSGIVMILSFGIFPTDQLLSVRFHMSLKIFH